MSIKILTKNSIDNTNIDGARDFHFNAGLRNGIVKGALNEGNFFTSSSNVIALDTCELRICGHRILIDAIEYFTMTSTPVADVRYSLIAQVIVDNTSNPTFSLFIQTSSTPLIKDNLLATTVGAGTYQIEIGRFTHKTDGTVTDIVRTVDLITGGTTNSSGEINIGTIVTNTLSAGMNAEVDVETRLDPNENKTLTDFTFSIPKGDKGDKGDTGNTGATGAAIVSTVLQGQDANGGNVYLQTFDNGSTATFTAPKGSKGDTGNTGSTGVTPNISVAATTLAAGSSATVTKTGTNENPTLTFGIPKGDKGDKGDNGGIGLQSQTFTTLSDLFNFLKSFDYQGSVYLGANHLNILALEVTVSSNISLTTNYLYIDFIGSSSTIGHSSPSRTLSGSSYGTVYWFNFVGKLPLSTSVSHGYRFEWDATNSVGETGLCKWVIRIDGSSNMLLLYYAQNATLPSSTTTNPNFHFAYAETTYTAFPSAISSIKVYYYG